MWVWPWALQHPTPPLSSLSPVSPWCPFDLALNHKQTTHTNTHRLHEKLHTNHIPLKRFRYSQIKILPLEQPHGFIYFRVQLFHSASVAAVTSWVHPRHKGCRRLTGISSFRRTAAGLFLLSLRGKSSNIGAGVLGHFHRGISAVKRTQPEDRLLRKCLHTRARVCVAARGYTAYGHV